MNDISTNHELVNTLRAGGVAVVRTDTIYGLVASADDETACKNVYVLKKRTPTKSCIILIDTPTACFGSTDELVADSERFHYAPTSFLIDSPHAPTWLLRENDELAYRVPADEGLRKLLKLTGPLIAPSANPEGLPPARNIDEARAYFGDGVDIYVDGGEVPADVKPSRLVRIHKDRSEEWLRQ